jgi:hypothetical protein
MFKIRNLDVTKDLDVIDQIWKAHYASDFSLPDLTNAATFAVVEDDSGNIVAFGIVKVFAEAIMIVDMNRGSTTRVKAMKLLMDKAENDCKNHNIKQLHLFCKNDKFADLLINHFDFKKITTVGLQKEL